MSVKRDHALDRKAGIKEGSARDMKLDKERGVNDAAMRRRKKKK